MVLVSTVILARLLTPADFGVVALALVFMGFLETLQDLGLTQALIVSSPAEEPASLGATHDSLARKRLDYRVRTFAEGADVLTRGATGVVLALAGFGAWSLVSATSSARPPARRAWILLAVIVPYLIALFVALRLFTHEGILAVAISLTAVQSAAALISIVMAGKILEVPYCRIGRAIAAPLGAALGMGAVVFPIAEVVESNWERF